MKAAQINQYGGPSVFEINEIDKPAAGEGQVLVVVHASSINPFDVKLREGYMKDMIPIQFPVTLGGDIAGVIEAVGEGVTGFEVGDKVYGQANAVAGNSGAFAENAATAAGQIAHMPEGLGFKEAAALPLVGVSAWRALVQHINLQPGQKLFVHGGSGGIGSVAIQIAKHLGAHVAATAAGDGLNYVRQLGADKVIDYKTQDFTSVLSGYDAVFDASPGQDFSKTFSVLKPGGTAVSMSGQADEAAAAEAQITALTQSTKVTAEALDALRALVESGIITPQIDKVFPLAEIRQAFEMFEAGAVRGKFVIEMRPAATPAAG